MVTRSRRDASTVSSCDERVLLQLAAPEPDSSEEGRLGHHRLRRQQLRLDRNHPNSRKLSGLHVFHLCPGAPLI